MNQLAVSCMVPECSLRTPSSLGDAIEAVCILHVDAWRGTETLDRFRRHHRHVPRLDRAGAEPRMGDGAVSATPTLLVAYIAQSRLLWTAVNPRG